MPPVLTAATFAADIFSLGGTGKTVSDHGISFVMQQDCALLRSFQGAVCQDYAPSEDTPLGALAALDPLGDPSVNPAADDPMILPRALAFLDGPLGLAATGGAEGVTDLPAAAFVGLRGEIEAGPADAPRVGLAYLAAGIGG